MKLIRIAILSAFIAISALAQLTLPPEENNYFLYWGEQKAGYFSYTMKPFPDGWHMSGETFMNILAGGKPGMIRFVSEWELSHDLSVVKYEMKMFSGYDIKQSINVEIDGDTAFVEIDSHRRAVPIERPLFIIDTNTPDGWVLLSKAIDANRDSSFQFTGLQAQLARSVKLNILPGHIEGEGSGEMRKYFAVMGGLEVEFYMRTRNKRLVYWNPKGAGFTAKWTPELDKDEFSQAPSEVDIMSKIGGVSHIAAKTNIDNPATIAKLEVELSLSLAEGLTPYVITANQNWKGETDGAKISGTAKIERMEFSGKGSERFPAGPIAEPDAGTLAPSAMIQSNDSSIVELTSMIVIECENFWEAAVRIATFVFDSVRTTTQTSSARTTLLARNGDALSKSWATCALLRAAGIPARVVGGFYLENNYWIRHHWVEVWIGQKPEWIPFDTVTGEIGLFTAGHIALWVGEGGLMPSAEAKIDIISWN